MTVVPSTPDVNGAEEALRQRRKRRRLALAGVLTVIVGAALLTPEMSGTSPLNDSLHVKRSLFGGIYEATAAGTAESPRVQSVTDTLKARHFASAGDSSKGDQEAEEPATECAHVDASGGALPLWGD